MAISLECLLRWFCLGREFAILGVCLVFRPHGFPEGLLRGISSSTRHEHWEQVFAPSHWYRKTLLFCDLCLTVLLGRIYTLSHQWRKVNRWKRFYGASQGFTHWRSRRKSFIWVYVLQKGESWPNYFLCSFMNNAQKSGKTPGMMAKFYSLYSNLNWGLMCNYYLTKLIFLLLNFSSDMEG